MAPPAMLGRDELLRYFAGSGDGPPRIGIEVECGVVDPDTGAGVADTAVLLRRIATECGGTPQLEDGWLVAVALPSGARFSLELGGALEYSSAPAESLGEVVTTTTGEIGRAARIAADLGLAVLATGMLPMTPVERIPWIPKTRVDIMRAYFARLGDAGARAEGVMGLTLSTQATFDYRTAADLVEKLRLLVLASPIAAAMFVNSPYEAGRATGQLSTRLYRWEKVDPDRCGVLPFATSASTGVDDLVDWALRLPMIYRVRKGRTTAAPPSGFAELLRTGFGDGTWPDLDDWDSHLSQLWPHARVRRTLESRVMDGLPWPMFSAAPAFWTGLIYDPASLTAALRLLGELPLPALTGLSADVARHGLAATCAGWSVAELAGSLLELSEQGLQRRVARGLEPDWVPGLLHPLREILSSGVTFAERALLAWGSSLAPHTRAFVAACAVPPG